MREMFESLRIVYQLLGNILVMYNNKISNKISKKNFYFDFFSIFQSLFNLENLYEFNFSKINLIEKLIYHFKKYSDGAFSIPGFVYQAVEAGKGEFGVSVLSDGSNYLYRCKIRSAAYNHLQLLSRMCQGHFFVDMITILGSQDIVFGEVDR
jgi:NADH:ubiquinone oxidoreductase subunit D